MRGRLRLTKPKPLWTMRLMKKKALSHIEVSRRGGLSRSDKKLAAVRRNVKKATAARKKKHAVIEVESIATAVSSISRSEP